MEWWGWTPSIAFVENRTLGLYLHKIVSLLFFHLKLEYGINIHGKIYTYAEAQVFSNIIRHNLDIMPWEITIENQLSLGYTWFLSNVGWGPHFGIWDGLIIDHHDIMNTNIISWNNYWSDQGLDLIVIRNEKIIVSVKANDVAPVLAWNIGYPIDLFIAHIAQLAHQSTNPRFLQQKH